jgi:uncharacterized protein
MTRVALLLAAGFAACCVAAPAPAQDAAARRATISVTGSGETQLKPDFARLSVSVGTTGDTVIQAAEANRAATDRVLARLQALGVRRDDIRTASLQVVQTPSRTGPDGRELRVPRFTARHQLAVITRDLDGIGRLAGEILAVGDLTFQSLVFGLDRQDEGRDEARRLAVRDARRQAEVYAAAAEVKLGRLLEIRDGAVQTYGAESEAPLRMEVAQAPGLTVVPPATVRSSASVQMVWELAP